VSNSKLPRGWIECRLDDVYCLNFGQSPSTTTYNDKGVGLPFFQGKAEFQEIYPKIAKYCSVPKKTAKKNSTLLSLRAPVGPTNLAPEKCAIGRGLASIRPMCKVDYMFTLYLLRANEQKLKVGQKGTTFDAVTSNQVKNLAIKFPPLNEQKRIVTKIEKLFSNLDNSDKYLAHLEKQLKRYRQSVLKSAFEGELTREWREKQTDLESAKELLEKIKGERLEYIEQEVRNKFENKTEKWIADKVKKEVDKFYSGLKAIENIEKPFAIPKKWEWIQWEQILKYGNDSFKRGPFGSALKKAFFVKDNTYKVYEQYCPINDDCSFERYYISEDKFTELKSFEVKEKDYLISCSGSIGKITQIPKEYKNGVINQALLRVRINDSSYLDKFFITLFRSSFFQDNITDSSTGSAMINLKGVKELKALPLPMLSIAEQNEIVKQIEKHFSIIDKLDSVVQNSIKESKRLRQSILKQAFEGKLVEQDPNDESAEILLEKIAKAKEEYKKEMSKRKRKKK